MPTLADFAARRDEIDARYRVPIEHAVSQSEKDYLRDRRRDEIDALLLEFRAALGNHNFVGKPRDLLCLSCAQPFEKVGGKPCEGYKPASA